MTFDNVNVNANELFGVKVSFGNEIRRASCQDYSYAALCELVAKLFAIDPTASLWIKYQDVDGDNITMSSDAEVRDAVQLAKEAKKTLRLIVEVKAKAKEQVPTEPVAPPAECPPSDSDESQSETSAGGWGGWGMGGFGHRWSHGPRGGRGFHHRGGWGGFPHHGFGPHGFPHQGPHHGSHHGFGHHGFPFRGASEFPCGPGANRGGPAAQGSEVPHPFGYRFGPPHVFGHGVFSPAPEVGTAGNDEGRRDGLKRRDVPEDWDAMRKACKLRKCAMKETLRAMKETATTPEDKLAIKEFKARMKAECKAAWKECRKDLKEAKKEFKGAKKDLKEAKKNKDRFLCKHVEDVTIPDNSELPADTPVVKTWKLKNAGEVEWPAGSQLLFISKKGDNLNGPEKVVIEHAVLPQAEVEVSVPIITPSAPGRYIGYYRMATPEGVKFGPRMWVSFVIAGTVNATTTTVPTAPLYPHLHPHPHHPHSHPYHPHPHSPHSRGGQGDAMVQ